MKLNTNILKAVMFIGLASTPAIGANGFASNQYVSGTLNIANGVGGNYSFNGLTTVGELSPVTLTATILTQSVPVSKSSGVFPVNYTESETVGATTTRVTNATILELAGIVSRGVTLGYFTSEEDSTFVAVTRSGRNTSLQPISVISYGLADATSVTSTGGFNLSVRNSKFRSASSEAGVLEDELTMANNTFPAVNSFNSRSSSSGNVVMDELIDTASSSVYTESLSFRGFIAGDKGLPEISYTTDEISIGQNFTAIPTAENASIGQTTWKATGLPSGLTINPLTGVISGRLNSGVLGTIYAVVVTATNAFGSTETEGYTITIVPQNNG